MGKATVSKLHFLSRAAFTRFTAPLARAFLRAGFTADAVTIIGTAASVLAALTLFPTGRLFAGTFVIWFFVMFDMLDGAMARESGGGSRFGAVLDATCDRISDGAVFCGLAWWAAFGLNSPSLVVATLICLVTSQVISYIKARAEASGLRGDGGFIERPERFIIVLVGAGLSDLPVVPLPWALHVAMWVLAVASMITCAQRLHTVRHSPGAADPMTPAREGRGEVESGDDAGQNGPRRSRAIRPKREPGKPGKSEQ
jgi:CDP-diacylglycerol---glycerol-3-phosphate 3-phosphatidyltransferase